ncbi:(2Fe-2S)-binding protein [Kitasatospora sp. A2-31]|uniref:(2Fe-2S)-binding protein n=1 Tax=Kitasatospora sp. A2-31 TaxID=2916414 RepID=UPI001EE79837|nr:(2Fe-2S)-binding protein [Kitasatospora sp. A2-31]MCG6493008.1 iron-sulfur protein [Kitasatospora sp. A2-31]
MTVSSTRPGRTPRDPAPDAHDAAPAPTSATVPTVPTAATVPTVPTAATAATAATTPGSPRPCAASYHRLGESFPALRVHHAPPRTGNGWLTGADLVARPEALRELIAHDARQALTRYGRPLRPDVAAGFGLHRLTWAVSLLFTLPWFLERRVPLLAPGDVSVRRRTGELTARPGAFLCLSDDPAAGRPGARPATGEPALAAGLRTALAGLLTPVLAAFRPEVRRGPRTLWAMATDAAVEGLWYVGGLLGEEERARTELTALFAPEPAACPEGAPTGPRPSVAPFTPGAGFAPARPDAPAHPGAPTRPATPACPDTALPERARASCCLLYTVLPEAMCGGCPRVTRG